MADNNERNFKLLNNRGPIGLLVEVTDESDVGIDTEEIRIQVEGQLRSNRIYDDEIRPFRPHVEVRGQLMITQTNDADSGPYLQVSVNIVGSVCSVFVEFWIMMVNPETHPLLSGPACSWRRYRLGTHGGHAGYIIKAVGEMIDEFIIEYLEVNGGLIREIGGQSELIPY